jgi:adenylosuccinate lyase
MTERNRETAHKNVRRNYRKYKKKLRKKIATLLIRKENVKNSIHTEDSSKVLKSKNKKSNQN